MAEHREPNLDVDSTSSCSSSFQKTVVLRDWWLIKCSKEFERKRFGVAGTEAFVETRATRVFTSSPIIKAFDAFTLQASDGICITLRGFLNKERVVKSGFIPEISREFIFGFPPCWEQICNNCFRGVPFGTDMITVPVIIDKACCPILSQCMNTKGILEDRLAGSRDKSTMTEMNTEEINNKDGRGSGSRGRDRKTDGKSVADEKLLVWNKVQNTINDGGHGSEGLNKAKSSEGKDEGNEWKVDESKIQNHTNDGDHGSEGLDKAKSSDVEKYECGAIDNEMISAADGCGRKHTGADNLDKVTSMSATGESLTSEQRKGKLKKTSLRSLSKHLNNSSKPRKNRKSKTSEKTLKSDSNLVEPMNHSGSKVKESEENLSWEKTKRTIDFDTEVTPDKEAKKQKTNAVSTDSLGQKRSRSGRVLVLSLEFWRNQIPVYDMDRNLIEVKEGRETNSTPSKGKGSDSRKPRR